MEQPMIERAAKGDPEAFRELVTRFRGVVYAICLSHARLAADAEDLAQEVFVRVHRDLKDLREPAKSLPGCARFP